MAPTLRQSNVSSSQRHVRFTLHLSPTTPPSKHYSDSKNTTMHVALEWIGVVLYWLCWPVGILLFYLSTAVLAILKLLYWPIAFLLQPFVYFGRFILAILALPFRALVKLEVSLEILSVTTLTANCDPLQPLYNYVGVAALVGILGGLALYFIYNAFQRLLRLDSDLGSTPSQGRTVKQYRQEKARNKAKTDPYLLSPGMVNLSKGLAKSPTGTGRTRNLLDQTIMEEMDSDY